MRVRICGAINLRLPQRPRRPSSCRGRLRLEREARESGQTVLAVREGHAALAPYAIIPGRATAASSITGWSVITFTRRRTTEGPSSNVGGRTSHHVGQADDCFRLGICTAVCIAWS